MYIICYDLFIGRKVAPIGALLPILCASERRTSYYFVVRVHTLYTARVWLAGNIGRQWQIFKIRVCTVWERGRELLQGKL